MNYVLLIFISAISFFVNPAAGSLTPVLNICLTGSTEGIIPAYGEAFKNSAEMALAESPSQTKFIPKIKTYFYEATPFASSRATKRMIDEQCAIIIGYSTMNELLAAKEELAASPTPVVSIYAETDKRFNTTPYVMTLEPPVSYLVKQFTPYLRSVLPSKNGKRALLLTAVDQEGPLQYKEQYRAELTKSGFTVDTFDFLERTLDVELLRRERGKAITSYDAIFLLARAVNSSNLSDVLADLGAKPMAPLIIATKNLGSSQLPAFLDRLRNKEVSVFFPRYSCTTNRAKPYQAFIKRYRQKFSAEAMSLSADTYDTVQYALAGARRIPPSQKPIISASELLAELKKTSYQGLTRTRFKRNFQVSYRGYFIINVTKNGYEDVTNK